MAIFLISKRARAGRDVNELVSFSAITQSEDNVPIANDAEVTVKSVERIEHDGRRAGAGERRGDLLTDMSALADPENDNLPAAFDRCLDQIHGLLNPASRRAATVRTSASSISTTLRARER